MISHIVRKRVRSRTSHIKNDKIIDIRQLAAFARDLRKNGQKIVTTNGVFDILHPGHTSYLAEARSLGDLLIVAVNSDSSVHRLKGAERPINTAVARATVLTALASVDFAVVFSGPDPRAILGLIKPTIHVKGGDYRLEQIIERQEVERHGGEVILLPADKKYSTTKIIKTVLKKYAMKKPSP
jgi:D-glycero-beta-D-manno-heptose 1-phosphate adenylyltransferase